MPSHIYEGMDAEATQVRVRKGKLNEKAMADCLNAHYGFHLIEGTTVDDTRRKRDFYDTLTGIWFQFKSRASGDDILYDRFEPWHGWKSPNTVIGRDHEGVYDFFGCMNIEGTVIRMVPVHVLRTIIAEMEAEILDINPNWLPFYSRKYPNAQIRKHKDADNGRPKLLFFVPPALLEESKGEIVYYQMKWEN